MYKSILVIPDLHCPVMHQDAFKFIKWAKHEFKPDKVICLGDELDYHCLSFHETEMECPYNESQEFEEAKRYFSNMYDMFDNVDILESNHGSMVYRKAKSCRIPRQFLLTYDQVLGAPPGYKWHNNLVIQASNGEYINFEHGHRAPNTSFKKSKDLAMSTVQGHHHSSFEILYWQNYQKKYFGMTAGCLIDDEKYAFLYNKTFIGRPMLGLGWIYEGIPHLIPMNCDENKRWIKP